MKTKTEKQRFVFPDGSYQDFPHTTDSTEAAIVALDVDLTGKKVVNNELVDKTQADLDQELVDRNAALDARYKEERKKALASFELTIFPDSTLTQAERDAITATRQAWFDMTSQTNYPEEFVAPTL